MPIDPNRGLRKDNKGNMLWEVEDVQVETDYGPFSERRLVGQPGGGITVRSGPGGIGVVMYNDDPGVYYNERGGRVTEAIAQTAGFDTALFGKQRRKKDAMKLAATGIDQEYEALGPAANVVAERGEYRMLELAPGHFGIHFIEQDGKGAPLTNTVLTRKAADKLFEDLAGPEPVAKP